MAFLSTLGPLTSPSRDITSMCELRDNSVSFGSLSDSPTLYSLKNTKCNH